ncbi:hypothetical protein BDD12DRAFT_808954 [Trichophaea hybrida]|nr:hypothetical protein BDD12DRAFT_808954 [Trichophaea hybrida]
MPAPLPLKSAPVCTDKPGELDSTELPDKLAVTDATNDILLQAVDFIRSRPCNVAIDHLAEEFVNLILPQELGRIGDDHNVAIDDLKLCEILKDEMRQFFTLVRSKPRMRKVQIVCRCWNMQKQGNEKEGVKERRTELGKKGVLRRLGRWFK